MTGVGALACVGLQRNAYFESTMQIMYWQGLSKYAVQGWLAWMLLVSEQGRYANAALLYVCGV